jgi:hypothetical protein
MSTDREAGAKPEKKSRQDQHEQRGKKREEKCVSTSNVCLVMLYHLTPLFGQTSLKCFLHFSLGQTIIRQTILFRYAILCDETTDSFKWHFITYLTAMSRKRHVTIFMDHCATMAKANQHCLPKHKALFSAFGTFIKMPLCLVSC